MDPQNNFLENKQLGYFQIARSLFDHDVWVKKPHVWGKIWIYVLGKVNHKESKQFKRGTGLFSYREIQEKTGATTHEVDHCMRYLKSATMIATTKATRGFIITVLNYNLYQSINNYKSDNKSDTISEIKATQKRHRSDTINNNDNNVKNTIVSVKRTDTIGVPPKAYGNLEVNKILDMYKKHMGYSPTDRSPRNVAQSIRMNINSFLKRNKDLRPDLTFDGVLDLFWRWFMKRDELKGNTLDNVRRKMKMVFELTDKKWRGGGKSDQSLRVLVREK